MNNDNIKMYISCLQKFNYNDIVLMLINNKYYAFYNSNVGKNANDLLIEFQYDGVYKNEEYLFYYVGFDENKLDDILKKLNNYNVVLFDIDGNTKIISKTNKHKKLSFLCNFRKNDANKPILIIPEEIKDKICNHSFEILDDNKDYEYDYDIL